jgi:uncharacterized membrane protein YhfC
MALYITFPLTILIEVGFPVFLAFWVIRRYHTSWKLVGIGGVIYLASQMLHIPILDGIGWLFTNNVLPTPTGVQLILTTAILGGLAAGLCEETARLVGFRLLKSPVQNNAGAFSLGVGHAGVESIIVAGLPMLGTFISMLALKNVDPKDPALDPTTMQQIGALWNMAWYVPLASALERLVSISTQLSFTFIVLQVFIRKSYWWFVAAIFWHALVEGLLLGLAATSLTGGFILGSEVVLGMASAGIFWYLLTRAKGQPGTAVLEKAPV